LQLTVDTLDETPVAGTQPVHRPRREISRLKERLTGRITGYPEVGFPEATAVESLGSAVLDYPALHLVPMGRGPGSSEPETVVGWHRAGFWLFWKWQSRARAGRPKATAEIQALIRHLAEENPTWGAPRIHGELQKLGFVVSERTVARYLQRVGRRGDPGKSWLTFFTNHREVIAVRLFHRADADLPGVVLLLRHRARTSEDSALQRDPTPDGGVGRPTTA